LEYDVGSGLRAKSEAAYEDALKLLGEWETPDRVSKVLQERHGVTLAPVTLRKMETTEPSKSAIWAARTTDEKKLRKRLLLANRLGRVSQLAQDWQDVEGNVRDIVARKKLQFRILEMIASEMGELPRMIGGVYQDNRKIVLNQLGNIPEELATAFGEHLKELAAKCKRLPRMVETTAVKAG